MDTITKTQFEELVVKINEKNVSILQHLKGKVECIVIAHEEFEDIAKKYMNQYNKIEFAKAILSNMDVWDIEEVIKSIKEEKDIE